MAKKKKSSSKKKGSKKESKSKKQEEPVSSGLPDGFWTHALGILTIILAILALVGSFGTGGTLPIGLFDFLRTLTGYFAYLMPPILLAVSIQKLRSENNKIPRSTFWGLLVFIISTSAFIHLFSDLDNSLNVANDGGGGGLIGHYVDDFLFGFLNTATAGLILFVLSVVAIHFVLKIPLTYLLTLIGLHKKEKTEDENEKEETKAAASSKNDDEEEKGFQLNEGVPIQRSRGLGRLTKKAKKMEEDTSDALVTSSDPEWKFPPADLLSAKEDKADPGDVEGNRDIIKDTLADFNIEVEMQGANVGPRVTQYTLKPPSGVRLTKITALENNLALNLAATSIRIEAPIPGKRAVGIEVPNFKSASVRMRSIFETNDWKREKAPLAFVVGKDISGDPVIADLAKMPHLLIAGATGSGKSVMINALLSSLLYRNSPADMKLILVDPKQVELTPYNDIPHLLTPVITEPEKCISALKWAVAEMDKRYNALAEAGKRNIEEYNKLKKAESMPYITIVIDELADLMMLAARDVESLIVRLAQKSRAVGIHLVLATQRPSVDVITGLIKANIPARIAFTVTSQVDSRTIIDGSGAEKLLGLGDMLFSTPQISKPKRIQGVFIEDKEVNDMTDFLRIARAPEYDDEIVTQPVQLAGRGGAVGDSSASDDSLYKEAVKVVIESKKASASLLQRRLRVGYARAARLIEAMEEQGIIGAADGARPRDVLVTSMDDVFGDGPNDF